MSSQPPAVDMSVLSQLTPEQIAAVAHLFASGAIKLPQSTNADAGNILSAQQPLQDATPLLLATEQATPAASDREDGELDSDSQPITPVEEHTDSVLIRPAEGTIVDQGISYRRELPTVNEPVTKRHLSPEYRRRQEENITSFIRNMHSNGYGFNELRGEVSDQEELRRLYQKLSLPLDASSTKQTPTSASADTAVKRTLPTSQATPNRQEYLARLQAAKNKKTEPPLAPVPPESRITPKRTLDPAKTELIKQRLAAYKAEQAAEKLKQQIAIEMETEGPAMVANPIATATTQQIVATESAAPTTGRSSASSSLQNERRTVAELNQLFQPIDLPEKPLDPGATDSITHRLVIDISDEEDDLDKSAGVKLPVDASKQSNAAFVQASNLKLARTTSPSAFSSRRASTPNTLALNKKIQELEAAKIKLAELEKRSKSRPATAQPPATSRQVVEPVPVMTHPAFLQPITAGLPGINTAANEDVVMRETAVDHTGEMDMDISDEAAISAESDDNDDEFDDVYNNLETAEQDAAQPTTTADAAISASEDWIGTDSDMDSGEAQSVDVNVAPLDNDAAVKTQAAAVDELEEDMLRLAENVDRDTAREANPYPDDASDDEDNESDATMDTWNTWEHEEHHNATTHPRESPKGDSTSKPHVDQKTDANTVDYDSDHEMSLDNSPLGSTANDKLPREIGDSLQEQAGQVQSNMPLDLHNGDEPHLANSHREAPHDSALKILKAYRFHPDYLANNSEGFKSLTWSHKIDSSWNAAPICPWETSGGVCNDRGCIFQHFLDIALTDDELYNDLAMTRFPSVVKELCDEYTKGVEQLDAERKALNEDIETSCSKLVQFRRELLQNTKAVLYTYPV